MKRLTATLLAAAMCMGTLQAVEVTQKRQQITAMQVQQQARQQLLLRRARQLPLRMCIWMR